MSVVYDIVTDWAHDGTSNFAKTPGSHNYHGGFFFVCYFHYDFTRLGSPSFGSHFAGYLQIHAIYEFLSKNGICAIWKRDRWSIDEYSKILHADFAIYQNWSHDGFNR